ncbi:HEAT repeat-containing protein 1 [Aricia agestis]|uniref:HEAT repeat-containing protein 1 n=1 Tax=Aricia agestis TaxID=91739 RepID=UPI001C20B50E|nr:HEAT repeat-containing protein 1 [Aricia agestis]
MATTSLAEQLQKLSAPQTSLYKDDKKRASLLFDPKEAALKDRDTFYEIGVSGLRELIALYEGFRPYQDSLFSVSSKDFERAVESKEVNKNLDHTIEKFLLQLSPYFLLQSSHKALEWLVNRYHIHQYNQDAIMTLILPYHETKIFVRFIQLFDLKSSSNRWNWLEPLQKHGVSLTRQVLYNQCVSNTGTLHFISNMTMKYVNEFGERCSQLNTVFAFFCSTAIGTINTTKFVTEAMITSLLAPIVNGIVSNIADYRSSAYIILGYLSTKATFKKKTIDEIIYKVFTTEFDLTYEAVTLISLIYTHQRHLKKMPKDILSNISSDVMMVLCTHLKKLIELKISVEAFVEIFLKSVLPILQKDKEDFRIMSQLPEILLDEVDLKGQHPENVIRCILKTFHTKKDKEEDDESDLEIIDEDSENFTKMVTEWYSVVLKKLETKYPDAFDSVIKKEMSSDISPHRRRQLSQILGFKPAVAHKVGDTFLFENLNHINAELRVEAVKYIAKEFNSLKLENEEFLKDSIVARLTDDNIEVVDAALLIPNKNLEEVLDENNVTAIFTSIVSKDDSEWKPIIKKTITKFTTLQNLPVDQDTVLAVVPYIFPQNKKFADLSHHIMTSTWGKKFGLQTLKSSKQTKDNHELICQNIFNELFVNRSVDFNKILDINRVNKQSVLDVCLYILLKSASLNQSSTQDVTDILDLLLETIEKSTIIASSVQASFSSANITEFITLAKQNKLLFEFMEYVFYRLIEQVSNKDITKPWCNILSTPETVLVRRLFEIFIAGCGIPTYSSNYAKLLQELLKKLFNNGKERFEFVCNVASAHILYATNSKDVVNPELQIRSLKLISNFIAVQRDSKWIYESDVLIATLLFNLNHPVAIIRRYVTELMKDLQEYDADKNLVYVQLLKELLAHEEELVLDHEQILQILKTILTHDKVGNKLFRKNCLLKLTGILLGDTPSHVKCNLVKLLSAINTGNSFSHIVPALNHLEKKMKTNELDKKFAFDIYESNLLRNVYSQINESTVAVFSKEQVWKSIEAGLKEYRECVLNEDQTFSSPCALIMKEITEDAFKKVPTEKVKDLVYLITSAGTFSGNSSIASVASKVMKKLHLNFKDYKPILEKMLNAVDPGANVPKKKKTSVSMLSHQLVETDEWRIGVTLLEYVQNKKKMTVDNSFVAMMFQILNKCLRFEEQSYVEYTKQLILSSLWFYSKKFVDETEKDQMKALKNIFDVELVVQCIRGTQNPQTQHHALILLSHAAYMLPEQVLHHTMEIFTFMGSSVLRHDDAYSFQIIIRIIETLIPILVKLDRKVEEYSEKELEKLQKRVVPVLRIFADVVLHVPEHRRLPLYKKLIDTLGPSQFLWVFLALLLETHIAHFNDNKKKDTRPPRTLADKESPVNRMDFGQSILLEYPPEICLDNFIKLMLYMKSLPMQKDENSMDTDVDPSDIFSVNGHSPIQLRHYKYVIVTFMNSFISSSRFVQHCTQVTDAKAMETNYKTFIINTLTFIQTISKVTDEKTAKYWRVMLHHSYDLLDHTNNLLSAPMFLSVIRGLLMHTIHTVRRKSMELLNSKIQFSPEMFADVDQELLFSLLPPLLEIVKTIDNTEETAKDNVVQEVELNQQAALLSLKLLTRLLASSNPEPFRPVLETVTTYTCNPNINGNVMASVVLCLAELCSNLKAHALGSLRKFMPALIKVLKKQRKADTPELVLLSTVTAISKIVESVPLFLSPYLQKILYEYSVLLGKWQASDQESKVVAKLVNIKKKIATSIPPRVLIPVANETHQLILEKENYDAVGPLMSVLADSFVNVTAADFTALQQDLTTFFLSALQLRSDAAEKDVDATVIDKAEGEIVNALVNLVLKLSETSFRPFYFKIYDWAIRTNIDGQKDRTITFYRLSSVIADKLKGLFVLFAGHFVKNAAELLDACNNSKTEELFFDSEEKNIALVNNIIKTLQIVFLYDTQSFLNKSRFETLMQPVVDQLENTLGGVPGLKSRATELLIPCISQFAVAIADDSLWKLLNYQILLKTRHNDSEIRLTALECLVAMASQLGSNWLPLLAESVPFLAELLEDGDPRIETATKNAVRTLEQILGEPLEKYF